MRPWQVWTSGLLVVALLGGGGYAAYRRLRPAQRVASPYTYVTGQVTRQDIHQLVQGTAPLQPLSEQIVSSQVAGTVVQTLVAEGERVKAGQPLLQLQSDTLTTNLETARLALQQAQLALQGYLHPTQTQIVTAQTAVDTARANLASAQAAAAGLQVTAPYAGVVTGVRVVPGQTVSPGTPVATFYDPSSLVVSGSVPQVLLSRLQAGMPATAVIDPVGQVSGTLQRIGPASTDPSGIATVAVTVALTGSPQGVRPGMGARVSLLPAGADPIDFAGTVTAQRSLTLTAQVSGTVSRVAGEGDTLSAGGVVAAIDNPSVLSDVSNAQLALQQAEANLSTLLHPEQNADQVKSLQSDVDKAQIALQDAQAQVDHLTVKAPVDGVVSGISAFHPGDVVSAGQRLVSLFNDTQLQVKIPVDEIDVGKVKVGQPAQVSLDALPGRTYTAKVQRIAPEGTIQNDVTYFDVWLLVDPAPELKAGMTASVTVEVDRAQNVLTVPVDGVFRLPDGTLVVQRMNADGTPRPVPVQVGISDGTRTAVSAPDLRPGDNVVIAVIQTGQSGGGGFGLFGRGGGGRGGSTAVTPPGFTPANLHLRSTLTGQRRD